MLWNGSEDLKLLIIALNNSLKKRVDLASKATADFLNISKLLHAYHMRTKLILRDTSASIRYAYCVPAAYRLRTGCVPAAYRLRTCCVPAAYRLRTGCVPDAYHVRTICVSYAYHMRIK